MSPLDWTVLLGALAAIVIYGVWKGRGIRDIDTYLLAGRKMRWYTIALSVMATQASAITFLSTPGQAYDDGMRFVQFYFGLPLAMIVLCLTAVPVFHRLKVYTAYEFLESRFDLKTRSLAAFLFLVQRGLAAGVTIYAPAIILSVILGWNITLTSAGVGVLVIIYTAFGGTRAVNWTQTHQMAVIFLGMFAAFFFAYQLLPDDISFTDATRVAGTLGRLNTIDLSFDLENRYNIWSGLIGGFFLALAYFGTDQSQVQRYLTGRSIRESRIALLVNGLVKVPMQFFILFLGVMVFVFYQFTPPPLFFNPVPVEAAAQGGDGARYAELEQDYQAAFLDKRRALRDVLETTGDGPERREAETALAAADERMDGIRSKAVRVMQRHDPEMAESDVNYVFLTFVMTCLPAELNALASTTVVDIYRRLLKKEGSEKHYLLVSRLATIFWGLFAILFAGYAGHLGTLVEAVNILGSLFYGTILGIFVMAFYGRRISGTAVFAAALVSEAGVICCFAFSSISYLWYNVVGCLLVMGLSLLFNPFVATRQAEAG